MHKYFPNARIVSYSNEMNQVCASAARISTTKGDAFEIFDRAKTKEENDQLISKVLSSGHKSFIEHAVFTIAFRNVSAFVEQFFIECRLASFTIKSRRYVDFSKLGYYVPAELSGNDLKHYHTYMDMLFEAYQSLLGKGMPKEDVRFLLPYSFNSNFYCTINARELAHVIRMIRNGRGHGIPELQNLAEQIVEQIQVLFPGLLSEFEYSSEHNYMEEDALNINRFQNPITFLHRQDVGSVKLVSASHEPLSVLETSYQIAHPDTKQSLKVNSLLRSMRPRELEQLSYTFLISDMTLSGITHIVRHRVQSVIVPPIQSVINSKYIIPDSIKENPALLKEYENILITANGMMKQLDNNEKLKKYIYYYALSGNVMSILTTMNARELLLFIQLRTCNRAQWEVRDIAIEMLKQLRDKFPELFDHYGPSCFVKGHCPEGKLTCGNIKKVVAKFAK